MGEAAYCRKHTNRYLDAKGRCSSCDAATAESEARGREQERADVVAFSADLIEQGWSAQSIMYAIERGEHVGAASKEKKP